MRAISAIFGCSGIVVSLFCGATECLRFQAGFSFRVNESSRAGLNLAVHEEEFLKSEKHYLHTSGLAKLLSRGNFKFVTHVRGVSVVSSAQMHGSTFGHGMGCTLEVLRMRAVHAFSSTANYQIELWIHGTVTSVRNEHESIQYRLSD